MSFKILSKGAIADWLGALRASGRVVGPKEIHGRFIFGEIQDASELKLGYPTSILPPKKYLLPQREDLLRYNTDGSAIEPVDEIPPTVVLGVHTCDLHAIQLLDRVFAHGYWDQPYLDRRARLSLVGVECLTPCMPHSFCKSMGTLTAPDNYDLHLTDLGSDYAVDVGSEKGEELLRGVIGVRDGTDEDYRRINRVMSEKWPRFPLRLDFDVTELPSVLSVSYASKLWEELGQRCLACGMCTNVCPTCYCFNVEDEVDLTLKTGIRRRTWDSCQLDLFATVAGGYNFRKTRAARQRHRFFRKGKYQLEAYGLLGCVGCGRCAEACLVHITPVDTFNELYRRRAMRSATEVKA